MDQSYLRLTVMQRMNRIEFIGRYTWNEDTIRFSCPAVFFYSVYGLANELLSSWMVYLWSTNNGNEMTHIIDCYYMASERKGRIETTDQNNEHCLSFICSVFCLTNSMASFAWFDWLKIEWKYQWMCLKGLLSSIECGIHENQRKSIDWERGGGRKTKIESIKEREGGGRWGKVKKLGNIESKQDREERGMRASTQQWGWVKQKRKLDDLLEIVIELMSVSTCTHVAIILIIIILCDHADNWQGSNSQHNKWSNKDASYSYIKKSSSLSTNVVYFGQKSAQSTSYAIPISKTNDLSIGFQSIHVNLNNHLSRLMPITLKRQEVSPFRTP